MASTTLKRCPIGLVSLLLFFIVLGCAQRQETVTRKPISLKVVLTGPLAQTEATIPADLVTLCLPFRADECASVDFIPDVSLLRLDLERDNIHRIEFPQSVKDRIRRLWGRPATLDEIRRERQEALEKNENVMAFLTKPSGKTAGVAELDSYIRASGGVYVYLLRRGTSGETQTWTSDAVMTASVQDLTTALSNQACRDAGEGTKAEYLVALFPGASSGDVGMPPMTNSTTSPMAMSGEMATADMSADMAMYTYETIDGCDDFHCLKCGDRNVCSRADHRCGTRDCGHVHGTVVCFGGSLFYMRESQGFRDSEGTPGCLVRAKTVAEKLNEMLASMPGHERCFFTVSDENQNRIVRSSQTPVVWFTMAGGMHWENVVSVTNGDLEGYRYRANLPELQQIAMPANRLTKEVVAQWWSSVLTDHFNMMVLGEKPRLVANTRTGKVLERVWSLARSKVPTGAISMSVWDNVVENLTPAERNDLYLVARIVPKDFSTSVSTANR